MLSFIYSSHVPTLITSLLLFSKDSFFVFCLIFAYLLYMILCLSVPEADVSPLCFCV